MDEEKDVYANDGQEDKVENVNKFSEHILERGDRLSNDPDKNQKDDDEEEFDFSSVSNKLKSIFKSEKKVEEDKEEFKENNEEDFSVDFKGVKEKVKKLFWSFKGNEEESDEEGSVDFSSSVKFIKKNSKIIIPILFILISIIVSTHFRMIPSDLPITERWAENQVYGFYQQQIEAQVSSQYPNLPEQNKAVIVNEEFQKFLKDNKENVKRDVDSINKQYKEQFKDDNGDTYLLAIDPYLWYSQARNYINNGHLGDKIIDDPQAWSQEDVNRIRISQPLEVKEMSVFTLRDGRLDKPTKFQLNPYIGAYIYKIWNIFGDISLMRAMFLLPVVLIGLSMIPTFFIGRKLGGNVGGLFAALFLAVNGPLLGRTPGGFADTDPYNVLFPVFIAWLFLEAYSAKKSSYRWGLSILSGFAVGLYAAAWTGWSSMFLFILGTILLSLGIKWGGDFIKNGYKINFEFLKNDVFKNHFVLLTGYLVSSGLFVSLFKTFRIFYKGFTRPIRFMQLKDVGIKSLWPNVLTTVAEFNTNSLSNIIGQMGGKILFWFSLMGIVVLLFSQKNNKKYNWYYLSGAGIFYLVLLRFFLNSLNDPFMFSFLIGLPILVGLLKVMFWNEKIDVIYPILIIAWLLGTAYAFTKGVRFAILMSPAYALGLGAIVGFIYKKFGNLGEHIKLKNVYSRVLVFVLLLIFLWAPFIQAQQIAENEIPSMNDAWYNTLTKIKDNSQQAIITSWWDFGHWFVAIAERMVTFDGGDQGERIYWVGNSLLNDNEDEAVGVLRMLNCGQETVPHILEEITKDNLKSVKILKEVFPLSRNEALKKYQELGLSLEEAEKMIDLTHCEDLIENYYITSEDMVGKAGVWGHFGSWDFERAKMYQETNKLSRKKAVDHLTNNFGLSTEQAEKIHEEIQTTSGDRWISPWPGYLTSFRKCDTVNDGIRCENKIQGGSLTFLINLKNYSVSIESNPDLQLNSLVYATPEGVEVKKYSGEKIGLSAVLIPDNGRYSLMLTDPLQAGSMFTRLFFLQGHGLKCFEKFDDVISSTGERVITWKIDYSCSQDNKVFFKPEVVDEVVE